MSGLPERLSLERARVGELSPEGAASALFELGALQAALEARLRAMAVPSSRVGQPEQDRLLTPDEAANRLGVSLRWLYRNAKRLPFTRKLTRRTLRFHEAGLEKYIREKRA